MTAETPSAVPPEVRSYQQVWAEGICQVLEQVARAPFACQVLPTEELEEQFLGWGKACQWVRFAASGKQLAGEQAFLIPQATAVQLAQLLMGEPPDETTAFGDDYRDALGELLRQFAGAAASCWKSRQGQEAEFPFVGMEPPDWTPATRCGFRLTNAPALPLLLGLQINEELAGSLRGVLSPSAAEPQPPISQGQAVAETALPDIHVDLLLDVELPAALRFGQRSMLLRDILEFGPGAVVEVERPFEQAAELVVAGRIVARGEVVIVEGNYGLQITEIASPGQRIAALGMTDSPG